MNYVSTRNNKIELNFKDVFIKGLADDGGLFVPKNVKSLKSEDFDEEWEQCLFRICYVNPRLKPKVSEVSKILTFIKDEFLKEHEEEIGQIIAQIFLLF